MRTAADIRKEMQQLADRKVELLNERKGLTRDQVEHYCIEMELSDIRDNLKMLREEFKTQVALGNHF